MPKKGKIRKNDVKKEVNTNLMSPWFSLFLILLLFTGCLRFVVYLHPNQITEQLPELSSDVPDIFEQEPEGTGTSVKYNIMDKSSPVRQIEFRDVEPTTVSNIRVRDVLEEGTNAKFLEVYAIDPTAVNFTTATVTVMAKGNTLFKCKDWNYERQECFGEWKLLKEDLVPGQEYSFILTPDDPGYAEMLIANCLAEDAVASAGSWNMTCDNTYPGTALFNDDSTHEVQRVRKVGGTDYWAGLRINSTNTSVTNCSYINEVFFCYKWWSETANIDNCDVSVDADGGASYTALTTTCPGTSEPGSVTCVEVTDLESWTCDNFFNTTGAFAKSEVQHSGAGGDGYFDITWDVFFFNVTSTIDYEDPVINSVEASPELAGSGETVVIIANITDNDVVINATVEIEGVNYSMYNYNPPATLMFEDFEAASINTINWETYSSTGWGRIRTITSNNPYSQSYQLALDVSSDNRYTTNELITKLDFSGYENINFTFWFKDIGDENHLCSNSWTGHANGDCVAMTCDDNTWYNVFNLTDRSGSYTKYYVNVTPYIEAYCPGGLTNENFRIKFQQYDDYMLNDDGIMADYFTIKGFGGISDLWRYDHNTSGEVGLITYKVYGEDPAGNSATPMSGDYTVNDHPTTPTSFTCDGETCSEPYSGGINISCSGSTDTEGDTITYVIEAYYNSSEPVDTEVNHDFETTTEGFAWEDDLYQSTNNPNEADGERTTDTANCPDNSCLHVILNTQSDSSGPWSGGWKKTIYLPGTRTVNISFDYKLRLDETTENNEIVTLYVRNLSDDSDVPIDYLEGIGELGSGVTNNYDVKYGSGNYVDSIPAGTYEFDIGCHQTDVSYNSEDADCFIDNVMIKIGNVTGLYWRTVGNHTEGESYFWNISDYPDQTGVDIKCRAIDNGSNVYSNYYNPDVDLMIDNTPPPTVILEYPVDYEVYDQAHFVNVTFNCSATENLAGLKNITLYLSNIYGYSQTPYQTTNLSGLSDSAEWTVELGLGNYTWNCLAYDVPGNAHWAESNSHVTVDLPDLTPTDITFSDNTPIEGDDIMIYGTTLNKRYNTSNIIVKFFEDNCSGTQVGLTQTISKLDRSQDAVESVLFSGIPIGPHNIFFCVDPDDAIVEYSELNNQMNQTIHVPSYQYFYGDANGSVALGAASNETKFDWISNNGTIYATDIDGIPEFSSFQALGRTTSGAISSNDFTELDNALGSSTFQDSITALWSTDGSLPRQTTSFVTNGLVVSNVPYINSTDNGNFITGILWDTSTDTDGEYSAVDNELILFVSHIRDSEVGKYGTYDYEIRIPALLRSYYDSTDQIMLYIERR